MKYITIVLEYSDDKDPPHFPVEIKEELLDGNVVALARWNALDRPDLLED